jgi:serine/threonine protein kinase
MDARWSPHPTDQTLSAYGLGKLDDRLAVGVNEHLQQCSECRGRVAAISADSFLERVREAQQPSGKTTSGGSQPDGLHQAGASHNPSPPPVNTLPPGLADHPDYEIKRELGRGGMGVVYLAHNKLMGRDEVLKVMGRQVMERPGVLERFLREIRAVAKLRHPNIVAAYSAVRLGESIVFAMEYVEGLDLAKLVKAKGPLPVAHACSFAHQAALGLQHAHEQGLVHRDIKPGNLMLSRNGDKATVKVLDFGLAKVTREEKVDGGLTTEGQALGTPDFIAPEQIIDAPSADIRADIYSLGGTLYYLLTGRPPFKANSLYDMFQAHISRAADPLNLVRPEIPAELAALVAKMMAKDPVRRFQTPGEVAEALTPFFKKGDMAVKGPRADISRAVPTNVPPPIPQAASKLHRTSADHDEPASRREKPLERSVAGSRWESLTGFKEVGSSTGDAPETISNIAPPRRPFWSSRSIAGASLFSFALLGVIIYVITKDWITKITTDGNDTTVEVINQGAGTKPHPKREVSEPNSPRNKLILDKLGTVVPFEFPNETPLEDVLKYVKKATGGPNDHGVQIYVDPIGLQEAEKTMISPVTFNAKNSPLGYCIEGVLNQLGLVYKVDYGMLYITSKESSRESLAWIGRVDVSPKDRAPGTRVILTKLEEPIRMEFPNETPLEEVIKHIVEATKGPNYSGLDIHPDPLGLAEAEKTITSPVALDLEGVPLKCSLRLMLKQLGLTYFVKNGLITITGEASRSTLMFPVEDQIAWKEKQTIDGLWEVAGHVLQCRTDPKPAGEKTEGGGFGQGTPGDEPALLYTARDDYRDLRIRFRARVTGQKQTFVELRRPASENDSVNVSGYAVVIGGTPNGPASQFLTLLVDLHQLLRDLT